MLEIKYKSIEDLLPYARNSRTHSDAQVSQIAASIREFGFTNPVLIDENGSIIAGHGRVMAAKKLKLSEVPTITLSHLSETQRRAYVIADNKLALNAGWHEEMLKAELAQLDDDGFNLELTGFVGDDLTQAMFGDLNEQDENSPLSENYSRKIEAPIYTPKGEQPNVQTLYDETKANQLKIEIQQSSISDEIKQFLIAAADRHTVFDFRAIAEYYAHADEKVQDLMEKSALVIIDYDKAIENGFVELSKAMMKQAGQFKKKENNA